MIASLAVSDSEDVSATMLGCNDVFATVIGDTGIDRCPCVCDRGIFLDNCPRDSNAYKEKSDLSTRPNAIEMRGEPSS